MYQSDPYQELIADTIVHPPHGPVYLNAECNDLWHNALREELELWPAPHEAQQLLTVCAHVGAAVARLAGVVTQVLPAPLVLDLGLWRRGVLLHGIERSGIWALQLWLDRLCAAMWSVKDAPNRARIRASCTRMLILAVDLALAEPRRELTA